MTYHKKMLAACHWKALMAGHWQTLMAAHWKTDGCSLEDLDG